MTRITTTAEKPAMSALIDIFEMSNMREPVIEEVSDMLELMGTHASIMNGAVVYEDDEVAHVHTMSMTINPKKKVN